MIVLLVLGILLVAVPLVGFVVAGTLFLYAALQEDGGDKVFGGMMASAGLGLAVLIIYSLLRFVVKVH